ncbi:cytochrome P450 CYP12A2-like isoform X1 [Danaus plexippus]|uniref:cytochrome P450 CYP12A2-like isoform X1 n=1 Tax=Danaus plexippus TaxID=13037 RepID=UPI002AB1BDAC|nr:cytochrome P450 CYP12A2-like isoform X1 [Danaus plexippus]
MNTIRRSVINIVVVNQRCLSFRFTSTNTIKDSEEGNNVKSWKEIPGPSTLPIIGQLHNFLPGGSLYGRFDEKLPGYLYETYGPIVRLEGNFGSPPMIFLYDAEPAMHIFRNENILPLRPGFQSLEYFRKTYNKKSDAVESTGLLTEHEEAWKKFRSAVNPVMLQPKTIKLYTGILAEVADDMISRMKNLRNKDNIIESELNMEMNLWSLESIGLVALGRRLNCFDPNLPEDSPVKELIKVVHEIFYCMYKLDFQPSLWRYFSTPAFKRAMKHYEDQIRLSEYFIEMAIKELKEEKKYQNGEKGILEKLLEIDQKVAVIMASDMLLAGVDTTATTIIALLYLLANNPEKQKKLRNEIMTAKDKRPYLRACIKESLRLLPVVGGNFRQTTKDYDVLGYRIPKKMFVVVANQYMSQMEKYYPKPHEFIPERWIVDKNDPLYYGNTHPFVHTPFGYGVRSCIGRRIAELEIETFAAKLIQNFDVRWFGPPIKVRATTLNYFVGPYNFIFNNV